MAREIARYKVSAASTAGLREATRIYAGSAMVLGDRWANEGCWNVGITDLEGVVRERSEFRQTLPMFQRLASRRSAL